MTYLVFDLVIAAILLLALFQGYRRGFILTLCGFLAVFVGFIGATLASNALAQPASDLIRPVIEQNISRAMEKSLEDGGVSLPPAASSQEGGDSASDLLHQLPLEEVLELLKDSKLYRLFSETVGAAVEAGILQVTASAARSVADYIAREIARIVLFFVCFALILVVWFLFSHALDLAFKLPVLSTLNHWTGAALGLVKGGLLLFIAAWLFRDSLIPAQAIRETVLLRFFCTTNPLELVSGIFQGV